MVEAICTENVLMHKVYSCVTERKDQWQIRKKDYDAQYARDF